MIIIKSIKNETISNTFNSEPCSDNGLFLHGQNFDKKQHYKFKDLDTWK